MVYTLVNNGDVPDEDYFNLSLMNQAVIVCTSGTRPASPVEGMTIYETDTNGHLVYDGSTWQNMLDTITTSYSPSWTGSSSNPTLGNGSLTGQYLRISAKLWWVRIVLVIGSTSTGGSGRWGFTLPAAPTVSQAVAALCEDNSSSFRYGGSAFLTSGSDVFCVSVGSGGNIGASSSVPFTWAVNDGLLITGIYEAA